MVNTIYLLSFVETPRKLQIINLRGVSTKLNKYNVLSIYGKNTTDFSSNRHFKSGSSTFTYSLILPIGGPKMSGNFVHCKCERQRIVYIFIYVNNTLPLALVVHEISRHFWAAYVLPTKNPLITQGSHKSTAPGIVTIIDIEGHDENEASQFYLSF